jgi:hypothetical protein
MITKDIVIAFIVVAVILVILVSILVSLIAIDKERRRASTDLLKIVIDLESEKKGYPPSADYYKAMNQAIKIVNYYR